MIVETRVLIYDNKLNELIGKEEEEWGGFIFDLNEVAASRPFIDEGKLGHNKTCLYFKSGESFVIDMSFHEFSIFWKNKYHNR